MQTVRSPLSFGGGDGFNPGVPIPSLSSAGIPLPASGFFYVHSLSPDWKLGVGAGSGFGSGLNDGKEWMGRYYIQKAQLLTATLNPGIAYRVNNWLSIGAGFSVTYALFSQTSLPTSIHNMTPSNRFIQTLATIPIAPSVAAHSIIAVKGDSPVERGSDGIVEYTNAHIEGVESELVVNSGHSAQSTPHTVEEVRRILLVQASETCAKSGIACVKPVRQEESAEAESTAQAQ